MAAAGDNPHQPLDPDQIGPHTGHGVPPSDQVMRLLPDERSPEEREQQ